MVTFEKENHNNNTQNNKQNSNQNNKQNSNQNSKQNNKNENKKEFWFESGTVFRTVPFFCCIIVQDVIQFLKYMMEVKQMLPKDPVILLSVVNTKLRDFYPTLDALCDDMEVDREYIENSLKSIGYVYNSDRNSFV